MALHTATFKEEATCSICLELMIEPMSIDCGHNFCRSCLTSIIENQPPETFHCALCRTSFTRNSLRPNKQLANLIDSFREMSLRMCEEHEQRLLLFCEDDDQLICWCCERSAKHRGHVTTLVEDARQDYKTKLERAVTKLKQMQDECKNKMMSIREQMTNWEKTVEDQKENVQSEFKNLNIFLQEEEKFYLSKLDNKTEQALKKLQDDNVSLKTQSNALKDHILELEKKCQEPENELLQNVKDTLSRSSSVKLKLPEPFSLDLNTDCKVSELYFDVRKKLKSYQVNITLDPETAHRDLKVSKDRRCVSGFPFRMNLKNILNATKYYSVLGCEGFSSGRHYFEVDVGDGNGCGVGVCLENVERDDDQWQDPLSGFWTIRLCQPDGCKALTSPPTDLHLMEHPRILGVFLDLEAGLVSFYNMTTSSHIFTFPKACFPGTLRPFFQVCGDSLLCLPPPDN